MINQVIHRIKLRQEELQRSIAGGTPSSWENYRQMVGIIQGLQEVLNMVDDILEAEEHDHQR
jgi:hypothetical protein